MQGGEGCRGEGEKGVGRGKRGRGGRGGGEPVLFREGCKEGVAGGRDGSWDVLVGMDCIQLDHLMSPCYQLWKV